MSTTHPQAAVSLQLDPAALAPLVEAIVAQVLGRLKDAAAAVPEGRLAYTEREAAALLGLKDYQLRDERLRGRVHGSRGPRRSVLYSRADLEAYLARQRTEGETHPAAG